jgi:hypothetical protein
MGWNSFDAYDSTITESQFRACVEFVERELKPSGWDHVVIDYLWYDPDPKGWDRPGARLGNPDLPLDDEGVPTRRVALDEFGRALPAPGRFPSVSNGAGFKPLADWVHAKGMKFGIHLMRGIPRQAYYDNLPIKGSTATARDIAEPWDACPWSNYMFGVDATKPGAQEYYDSLMELYASWGVDYLKVDDILFPVYSVGEIECIRRAIDRSGRPMTLSLSPGAAPLSRAAHLKTNANLWRISPDFWDEWGHLYKTFGLLEAWSPHAGPGHWPDADMIPFGRVSLGGRPYGPERNSEFTPDEMRTLMTLWCVARSPLMWGGDPLTSSPEVLRYLTNAEVLAVNQRSTDNRQAFRDADSACWVARDPDSQDCYVALFNLSDNPRTVALELEHEGLRGVFALRGLWDGEDLGNAEGSVSAELPAHGATIFRLSPVTIPATVPYAASRDDKTATGDPSKAAPR